MTSRDSVFAGGLSIKKAESYDLKTAYIDEIIATSKSKDKQVKTHKTSTFDFIISLKFMNET